MAYTDGDFTTASQTGAKQISHPLIQEQEYYCTITTRRNQQLSQYFNTIMRDRTSYLSLLTFSQDLSNAAWTKTGCTVASPTATDPEGGSSAAFISENTDNSTHGVSQVQGALKSGAMSLGAFVKAGTRTFVRLRINNNTDNNLAVGVFNLSTGTLLSGSGTAKRLLGGWWWLSVSGTASTTGSTAYVELSSDGSTFTYAGDSGFGLYVWNVTCCARTDVSPSPPPTAVTPAIYTTAATRTVSVPPVDSDDPISFLVDESPADTSSLGAGVSEWDRVYARVSRRTTIPSSVIVSKPGPNISGVQMGIADGFFFRRVAEDAVQYDIYAVNEVDLDTGIPSFVVTGGYYTLSAGGATTATIAYNATAGAVAAQLNALIPIASLGGVSVVGTYSATNGFQITFTSTSYLTPAGQAPMTINKSSLTVAAGRTPFMFSNAGSLLGELQGRWQSYQVKAYSNGSTSGNGNTRITGGEYSLNIFGQTTATLTYNATAAQIASALNALSTVSDKGGIAMLPAADGPSGFNDTTGHIDIVFNFVTPTISGEGGTLEPANSQVSFFANPAYYNRVQSYSLVPEVGRGVVAENHGILNGDQIFVRSSYITATSPATIYATTYYAPITNFIVVDDNTISLRGTANDGQMIAATILSVGARRALSYDPGARNVRCKRITDYYLPGFTPGINSIDDIPIAEAKSDGYSFFSALLAGDEINYSVGEVGVWRGPILYQSFLTVKAEDIADFLGPTIQVKFAGGAGKIVSTPVGINTTIAAGYRFTPGITVKLQAIQTGADTFVSWSGTAAFTVDATDSKIIYVDSDVAGIFTATFMFDPGPPG